MALSDHITQNPGIPARGNKMADDKAYQVLEEKLGERGVDIEQVKESIKDFWVETPSWGYADSGTRFGSFPQAGAAETIYEKLQDAACVHEHTGCAPSAAVHTAWDFAEANVGEVQSYAQSRGIEIGAVNPTLFEEDEYKFGSLASPAPEARRMALDHVHRSIEIMKQVDSDVLSMWLADGTNYPGQDNLRSRKQRMTAGLQKAHDALPEGATMLVEYKLFEPAFYATDIADWGASMLYCQKCGPQAKVLVDLGHHALGTNIEQIVAFLTDEDMLGGFHFNNKKYADDDLTSGSTKPYELFLIFNELVAAAGGEGLYDVAYMIDQSHNIKPKVEAMIQSVVALQETYAKALTVNRGTLREAQKACDTVKAEEELKRAFFTDVRPLLEKAREEMGVSPDPLQSYRQSGYQEKVEKERS